MSDPARWLQGRVPAPPPELATRLGASLGPDDRAEAAGSVVRPLTHAGVAELERALGRPGRVRESAFHLLTADALFTYACEAALDDAEPEATLRRVLEVGAGP